MQSTNFEEDQWKKCENTSKISNHFGNRHKMLSKSGKRLDKTKCAYTML